MTQTTATINPSQGFPRPEQPDLWFTRCPVPTATGIAYKLGWLEDEFANDGITVRTIQDRPAEFGRYHYDHQLPTLIREGGNMLALAARAQGARTRLVGLTWIEERQAILVLPDSGINHPADLRGRRLALPRYGESPHPDHVRGISITRGMSLQGYRGALSAAGLHLDDVDLVEVPANGDGELDDTDTTDFSPSNMWAIGALRSRRVDALYVKGASAIDAAVAAGVVVGIDIDRLPDRHQRVNNGTPRPITVHQDLIDRHYELLVRFLGQTLRAADWAAGQPDALWPLLQEETYASEAAVRDAYAQGARDRLHPDLSDERLILLEQQQRFLWLHGFVERDFDLRAWADPRPLADARAWLAAR